MSTLQMIPLDAIRPNPDQPRKHFSESALQSLADSIREHGVMNPISVRGPYPDADQVDQYVYFILDGERRWRSSRMAGKETIPAHIHQVESGSQSNLELALIGNCQREDMDPVEEGNAYLKLRKLGYTLDRIVKLTGKSSMTVQMRMKIVSFEPEIQKYFSNGGLPLDGSVIYAIEKLPDDLRVKTVVALGMRHA